MLLIVEKGIRGEICHAIYRYVKANKKYMKDYEKKNLHIWNVGIQIFWMGGQCHKRCL